VSKKDRSIVCPRFAPRTQRATGRVPGFVQRARINRRERTAERRQKHLRAKRGRVVCAANNRVKKLRQQGRVTRGMARAARMAQR
jgi:hypothetical protein